MVLYIAQTPSAVISIPKWGEPWQTSGDVGQNENKHGRVTPDLIRGMTNESDEPNVPIMLNLTFVFLVP